MTLSKSVRRSRIASARCGVSRRVLEHARELRASQHAPRALLSEIVDAAVRTTGIELDPYRIGSVRVPHSTDPLVLGVQPPRRVARKTVPITGHAAVDAHARADTRCYYAAPRRRLASEGAAGEAGDVGAPRRAARWQCRRRECTAGGAEGRYRERYRGLKGVRRARAGVAAQGSGERARERPPVRRPRAESGAEGSSQ